MKTSILRYENYSSSYAGAVSLFVNAVSKKVFIKKKQQLWLKNIKINYHYVNIPLSKEFLKSQSKAYVSKFIDDQRLNKPDIIEVHNRPVYINMLTELNTNLVCTAMIQYLWMDHIVLKKSFFIKCM